MDKESKCPFYKITEAIESGYPCDLNLVAHSKLTVLIEGLLSEKIELDPEARSHRFAVHEILVTEFMRSLPSVDAFAAKFIRIYAKQLSVVSAESRMSDLFLQFLFNEFKEWGETFQFDNPDTFISGLINSANLQRWLSPEVNTIENGLVTAVESFFCYANVAAVLCRNSTGEKPTKAVVLAVMNNSRHLFFKLSSLFVSTFLTIDRVLRKNEEPPCDRVFSFNRYDPEYFELGKGDTGLRFKPDNFLKDYESLGLAPDTFDSLTEKEDVGIDWVGCPGRIMINYVYDFLEKVILESKVQFDGIPPEFTCTNKA